MEKKGDAFYFEVACWNPCLMFSNCKIHTEHKQPLTFFHLFRTRCWIKHDIGIDCKQQATGRLT